MEKEITHEEMVEMQELRKSLKGLPRETKTRLVESMKMFKAGYQFGLADGAAGTAPHTARTEQKATA